MSKAKKPRADSKLKNLPENIQEGFWQHLHPVDPDTKAWTLEELGGEIHETHGISVALSTLSEWHSWYALKRRMEQAAARANQTAIELAKNSDLTPEDIERAAQTVFTAEALQAGDVGAYVSLAKLRLSATRQQIEREKITAAAKSKIEAGLDALLSEIQGNPKALKLFNELKEVVSKA